MKNACILLALLVPLGLLGVACDDDDSSGSDGQAGSGQSGSGGSSGSAQAGKAGSSGSSAGSAGSSAGQGGSAGSGGSSGAGQGGSAGSTAGSAGQGGSSAGQGGSSQGGEGGSSQGGAGQGGEGGSSQGGAGQGGSGGQAAKSKQGSISVGVLGITEVNGLPAPIVTNTASASFFDTSGSGGSTGGADCQKEEFGDCQLITCTTAAGGSGGSAGSGGGMTFLNAGDITITGGAVTPIVLKQKDVNGTTTYQPDPALPTDKPILVGGEAMEVKAPGKDVPAFTLQATAPKSPKIEGYPIASSPGASVDIDTTKDLELKISDGGEGNLTVLLSTASNNNKSTLLTCTKPATSASLVISSAALKKVQAADSKATLIGALSVTKTTDVDDWSITLNLNNILRDKDNKPLSAFAQLNLK